VTLAELTLPILSGAFVVAALSMRPTGHLRRPLQLLLILMFVAVTVWSTAGGTECGTGCGGFVSATYVLGFRVLPPVLVALAALDLLSAARRARR